MFKDLTKKTREEHARRVREENNALKKLPEKALAAADRDFPKIVEMIKDAAAKPGGIVV